MLGTVPPNVSGVNFVTETVNVSELPVGLDSVMFNDVGWPTVTFPKLAETGSSHVVPSAATERFSRPAPWAVGPMSCKPVNESLITKSARLTRAHLICGCDQVEWRSRSTAAEPAMCGVHIDEHSACRDAVAQLRAEAACPAVDDRALPGGARVDACAASAIRVEKIVRSGGEGRELPNGRADRCSNASRIRERLADKMLVCARADRNDLARATRRLNRACPGSAVTGRYGHDQARVDCVVETRRQEIVVTMEAAA